MKRIHPRAYLLVLAVFAGVLFLRADSSRATVALVPERVGFAQGVPACFSSTPTPGAPSNTSASCDSSAHQASFSWDPVAGADHYLLHIKDNTNGYVSANYTAGGTSYAIPGLYSSSYSWWVQACGSMGCGSEVEGNDFSCTSSSCASNAGAACSPANICGQTNTGTIQCDGSCSVGAPSSSVCPAPVTCANGACTSTGPLPTQTCNPVTGCTCSWQGQSYDSSCTSTCPPGSGLSGSGTINPSACTTIVTSCNASGSSAVTVCPATPTISLNATPIRVRKGNQTSLQWSAQNVTSCTLSGSGITGDSITVAAGSSANISTQTTPATVSGQSTYTLTCHNPGGDKSASVTVTVVPEFQEL